MKILSYRRDIYLKIKLRTSTIQFQPKKERIFAKKNIFWNFSDFRDMLEDPLKFSMFNFSKISKKKSKNGFTGVYQTLKGTKSWILVNLAQTLWKWQTISNRPGTKCPPPVGIGLSSFWEKCQKPSKFALKNRDRAGLYWPQCTYSRSIYIHPLLCRPV